MGTDSNINERVTPSGRDPMVVVTRDGDGMRGIVARRGAVP
ncbi:MULTISPECIES: hypothetical protein [Novacetimonas]|uniref:Uncharacterized protein n=1 Tax=Novacetimonas hansenii ATCC 23769 TaxID=714995 RepID=D5QCA4_NOVHA|nr:hypothetical protein [Novacetimonas hansenii]EFG85300.1 hypothetical protein GXY_03773 [Novacetimonas hansenii ATCC 23769]WEQ60231.1 hypothetical protein LV563_07010 [Novacetimonas hansenii]CUW46413.1 hypothetical protein ATCC53582_00505 [Novacetimonas hansenii]